MTKKFCDRCKKEEKIPDSLKQVVFEQNKGQDDLVLELCDNCSRTVIAQIEDYATDQVVA